MNILNWVKKRFGFEGLTGAKLLSYSVLALFLWIVFGVFERLRDFLLDYLIPLGPPVLQTISNGVLAVLFYPINANILTLIVGIFVFIPLYHYVIRFLYKSKAYKSKAPEVVFSDDFTRGSPYNWQGPYWGGNPNTVTRTNGFIVFNARPGEWTKLETNENGALIDIINGIVEGYTYKVSCKAKADDNSTMQFRLWVHDIEGKGSIATDFNTLGPTLEEYSVKFMATKSNGMRIHLHCKAGSGRILVTDARVTRL